MKYKIYIFIMIVFFAFTVNAEGEATINNIKVNGTSCSCSGYECSVDITAGSATITYDLVDKNAQVDRLSGFKVDLLSEITTIKLTVTNSTNEQKIENIYNITINKKEVENDLSLKSLKVNGEPIKVSKDIVAYSYTSSYDAEAITIEVVPNDSSAKVIKQDKYEFPIGDGSVPVDFSIKPVSGEQLDYRVVVTRGVKPDTTLKSLKINGKEISLDDGKLNYEHTVEYSVNELEIEAIPSNETAKVEIDSKTLVVGENEVKITITTEKTKSEYVIIVNREENIDKSVANLATLLVEEYKKLDFKENVLDYTLNFSNIPEQLTITAKAKDENGKVEINGNENLVDGSKVTITVKLDTITREYTLLVKESKSISDNKKVILWAILGLSITIIVLLLLEIHTKKEEKRKYLKKIFDLRHKIERKRKEEKEKKSKEEKDTKKLKLKIKPKAKKEDKNDDDIEII